MAGNHSKTTKEVWEQVRIDYHLGNWKSLEELANRYTINPNTLRRKVINNEWNLEREKLQSTLLTKVEVLKESEVEEWIKIVKERSKKDWEIIDSSIDGMVDAAGGIEPSDLRSYIQARKVLDDMARRALGLADPTHAIDITSKGQSLGESLLSAISKLRESPDKPKLSEEDKQRILEAEIIDDDQV